MDGPGGAVDPEDPDDAGGPPDAMGALPCGNGEESTHAAAKERTLARSVQRTEERENRSMRALPRSGNALTTACVFGFSFPSPRAPAFRLSRLVADRRRARASGPAAARRASRSRP